MTIRYVFSIILIEYVIFYSLRHVGDLGNMLQSTQGVSSTQFRDSVVSLAGQNSIVGRALVVSNFTYHFLHNEENTNTNTNTNYIYI